MLANEPKDPMQAATWLMLLTKRRAQMIMFYRRSGGRLADIHEITKDIGHLRGIVASA